MATSWVFDALAWTNGDEAAASTLERLRLNHCCRCCPPFTEQCLAQVPPPHECEAVNVSTTLSLVEDDPEVLVAVPMEMEDHISCSLDTVNYWFDAYGQLQATVEAPPCYSVGYYWFPAADARPCAPRPGVWPMLPYPLTQ